MGFTGSPAAGQRVCQESAHLQRRSPWSCRSPSSAPSVWMIWHLPVEPQGGIVGIRKFLSVVSASALLLVVAPSSALADPLDPVWELVPGCDSSVGAPSAGFDEDLGIFGIHVSGGAGCDARHLFVSVKVCLEAVAQPIRCQPALNDGSNGAGASVVFPCVPGVYRGAVSGVAAPGPVPVRHSDLVIILPKDCPVNAPERP